MNPRKLIDDILECLDALEDPRCDIHDRQIFISKYNNRVLQLKDWGIQEETKTKEHHND